MTGVEDLYKHYGILADAAEEACNHAESYEAILEGVKADTAAKKLSCQFIPRFFKHFPTLSEQAIDAQLDLCEDDDNTVRRQAIKSLPDFVKGDIEHMPRVTDILTQLLQQEDPLELAIVRNGLETLLRADVTSALTGIFLQVQLGDEPVREKAIQFIEQAVLKMQLFENEQAAGTALFEAVKKVLSDVTAEEFTKFMSLLSKVKTVSSNPQNLADLITEQAELDKDFQVDEPESINRLITCTRQASPYFTKGASSEKYLDYIVKQVLPVFVALGVVPDGETYQLDVLKLLAELSAFASDVQSKDHLQAVFDRLLEYMPLPPEADDASETEAERIEKLNFSYIECLMYAFHKLLAKHKDFLAGEEAAAVSKDLKIRLQYLAQQVQAYIKSLRQALQGKSSSDLEVEANKIKVVALRTCNNINTLIKDLFHNPPSHKSQVVVSWKSKAPVVQTQDESIDDKRKRAGLVPISFDGVSPPAEKRKSYSPGRAAGGAVYTPPGQRNGKTGVAMDDSYRPNRQYNRGGYRGNSYQSNGYRGNRGGGGNRSRGGRGGGRGAGERNEAESFLYRD